MNETCEISLFMFCYSERKVLILCNVGGNVHNRAKHPDRQQKAHIVRVESSREMNLSHTFFEKALQSGLIHIFFIIYSFVGLQR